VRFDPSRPNNFDLLRFAAATLVLVDHSDPLTGRTGGPGPFGYETYGGFAVAVFFIISGFLVAASWERAPRLWAFALKRALRIFPAYAAVVTLAVLVLGPLVTDLPLRAYFRSPATWAYFNNLTFVELYYSLPGVFAYNAYPLAVNGSIWTLPIEVTMYVALAAFGLVGAFSRTFVTVLVALLAVAWFGWSAELAAAPPLYYDVLLTGYTVHLALWFFTGSALWLWREHVVYRADVAVALLVLAWLTEWTPTGAFVVHVAFPYVVVWAAMLPVRWMNRFGRAGDFSYGMYLYAFPVQQAVVAVGGASWPQPMFIAASFMLCLACAVASWYGIEYPALRLKPRRTAPVAPEAVAADLIQGKTAGSGGP
jgi:peptidoglycan/LPS O-acetylase OafA/YrhL